MGFRRGFLLPMLFCVVVVGYADDGERSDATEPDEAKQESTEDAAEEKRESKFTEKVVVSASATGETVLDAPAAVDVLAGEYLEAQPADHLADQLRRVPGINVVQFSARDVNVASRGATGGINNSTLALSDGRTLYQDFLGFTMWEFAPSDPSLVDRVEVVRGPASALWGASAVGGVVHVITKSPRDTLGGSLTLSGGNRGTRRINVVESFLAGDWALRVAAGFYRTDPFPRPRTIVNMFGVEIDPDLGLLADDFRDSGTEQPRVDLRADIGDRQVGELILQAGWARTRGWIATGLGPFDVEPSTTMSYAQMRYRRGSHEAQIDVNHFDGAGKNLINAIEFGFESASLHGRYQGRSLLGEHGVVGWGGEFRLSGYDLSIAPEGNRRRQAAAFVEFDVKLSPRFRLISTLRLDHVEETIDTVASPRGALHFKPTPNHTLRVAWGEAFRSPSVIESDLSVPRIPVALLDWEQIDADEVGFPFFAPLAQVVCGMDPDNCGVAPGEVPGYIAVTAARGSRELDAARTESLELGYAGRVGRFGIQASVYRTRSRNGIDFPLKETYGNGADGLPGTSDDVLFPADPDGDGILEAPPIDVCPLVNALPPFRTLCRQGPVPYNQFLSIMLDGLVPSLFQYGNGSGSVNEGLELGLEWYGRGGWSAYGNYSWQSDPEVRGVGMDAIVATIVQEQSSGQDLNGDGVVAGTNDFVNIPAKHRVSLGVRVDRPRWFWSATYDHVSRTFWQDVLTSDFWGFVPAYDLVGLRGGVRWPSSGFELTLQGTNLVGDEIQQHIYGDRIGRRVSAALTYRWGPPTAE